MELKDHFFGGEALQLLFEKYHMTEVLDVGCGNLKHAEDFLKKGIHVYASDIKFDQKRVRELQEKYGADLWPLQGDFNTFDFETDDGMFHAIWASHVLEHQLNVGHFLSRCFRLLEDGGIMAVTVPPAKPNIVGGHVTVWNAGLLLYNMILAGFDCSQAHVKKYGYNISVVVTKKPRGEVNLKYDRGDIELLAPYFPKGIDIKENFNGDILEHNWK